MDQTLQKAVEVLNTGNYTCVLCKEDTVYTSARRGIAPLMEFWDGGTPLQGFSAADKVVGKATALLYCLMGVRAVYAKVISLAAIQVLEQQGILCFYDTAVDAIQNRAGTGLCPMEQATKDIWAPALAPEAIRAALARLTSGL